MDTTATSITDLTAGQLRGLVASLGEPKYRAGQLMAWVYRGLAASYDEMTDLPLAFRRRLAQEVGLSGLEPLEEAAGRDGTVKALFRLHDGQTIEAALMPGGNRFTVCASTQVGCAVGCPFCATGQQGFVRNLTPGEIIDQVLYFARCLKQQDRKVDNIVFMGMGEPLANYAALMQAITMLNAPEGFGLGARSMTVSTAGLVPGIRRLGRERLQVGLAVSLHAPDDTLRNKLVPLNRKYPLEALLAACREYCQTSGRRVTFEYILFKGINDSITQARALAGLLKGLNCHVNLIPANATADPKYQPPAQAAVLAFGRELRRLGINATLRRSRGRDIAAGCGQLRSRFEKGAGPAAEERKRV